MSKKCKRCGACQECGAVPMTPYVQPNWITPYWSVIPPYPNTYPQTTFGDNTVTYC